MQRQQLAVGQYPERQDRGLAPSHGVDQGQQLFEREKTTNTELSDALGSHEGLSRAFVSRRIHPVDLRPTSGLRKDMLVAIRPIELFYFRNGLVGDAKDRVNEDLGAGAHKKINAIAQGPAPKGLERSLKTQWKLRESVNANGAVV